MKVDITTDKIYKDATDIECPVCKKKFSELKYAVPWISMGQQKIFTCSEEHAQEVYANPVRACLYSHRPSTKCSSLWCSFCFAVPAEVFRGIGELGRIL